MTMKVDMKPLRVYVDTSVIGGYYDEEFAVASRRVIEAARQGRLKLLVSDAVISELVGAPPAVRAVYYGLPVTAYESVPVDGIVTVLRDAYIEAGVVGQDSLYDATHVAAATVARADAICSWNFKHIARLDKIKAYNEVNQRLGYGVLVIVTPQGVQIDEPDQGQEGV